MKSAHTNVAELSDELLQRYFDGELPADERLALEARLDTDARLRLEALAELRGLFRASVAEEASSVDLSSVIESIARTAPVAAARPRRRLLPMSALGGLLAAAAALVFLFRPITPSRAPGNLAEVETLEVQGAIATVFNVENGDDSATVIWADDPSDDEGAL